MTEDHLWCPVRSCLQISVLDVTDKGRTAEVNHYHAVEVEVLEQYILRLKVAVEHSSLLKELETYQDILGDLTYKLCLN